MVWAKGHKLQDGKYVIEKELDQGGFGITYLVKRNDGQKFVVKTLNDDMQKSLNFSKYQQNFVNEALRLARCSHPHIVRVEELIQERNLWGIVMEYVDGETLADLVKREGLISQDQALRYIKQVGDALVAVHQNGFLHRDVKPQNIMVRASCDEAVLIDFGIAREFEQDKTQSHTQFLSRYFAPIEQYDKRAKRGAYTDVYALAGTLYYLVTGEYPIAAPNRAVGMELELPSEYNSDLDDWLEVAILKGLEIKPSDRPQSIEDWLGLFVFPDLDIKNDEFVCQDLFDRAERLETLGDLKQALMFYQEVTQLTTNHYEAWLKSGIILSSIGTYDEAIECIDKALQINPNSYEAWYERGKLLINEDEDEAIECIDRALQINPNSYEAWYERGKLLINEDEVIECIDKALEVNPNSHEAWLKRGEIMHGLERYEEAFDSFDKALAIKSDFFSWFWRAWILNGNELYQESVNSFKNALYNTNQDIPVTKVLEAWVQSGEILLFQLNKYEESIKCFNEAFKIIQGFDKEFGVTSPKRILTLKGDALVKIGRNEEAIDCYDKILQTEPKNVQIWEKRGKALYSARKYEESITAYDKAIEYASYIISSPFYHRCISQYKLNRYNEALDSINKALQKDEEDDYYWNYKGIILDNLERHGEAIDCYDRSLSISSDYVVWYNRAIALNNKGDYVEAIKSCLESLKIKPDYESALDFGDIFEGDNFLLSLLKEVDEEDFESCMDRGHALCELEQYQDAISFYELAISIASDYNEESDAWDCHANSLYRLGKYEEAIESWDQAICSNDNDSDRWIMRGKAFEILGDDIEAKASYRRANPAFGYDDSPTLGSVPSGRILYFNALEDINLNYLYDSIKKPYIDESNELDENSELEENSKFDESSFTV